MTSCEESTLWILVVSILSKGFNTCKICLSQVSPGSSIDTATVTCGQGFPALLKRAAECVPSGPLSSNRELIPTPSSWKCWTLGDIPYKVTSPCAILSLPISHCFSFVKRLVFEQVMGSFPLPMYLGALYSGEPPSPGLVSGSLEQVVPSTLGRFSSSISAGHRLGVAVPSSLRSGSPSCDREVSFYPAQSNAYTVSFKDNEQCNERRG